jgi:macrolide-specific efflux system membrane fusion protein
VLGGIVVVVVALIGWFALTRSNSDDDVRSQERWTQATVTRRDISSSIRATGIIKPMVGAEVRVGSRISGVVRRLYTNVGDRVAAGQLLAELDATDLQARLNQAVASLDMAQAELEYAEVDLRRKQELSGTGVVAQTELEMAENAFRVAGLRVEEAQANVAYSRTQLDYARIRAPISGVVASVSTQEGETVAASFTTPTFVTIIDLDRLELWAYVDETDIGRVVEGQRALFNVDTYPDTDFEGTVQSVYPDAVIENTVVNYITIVGILDRQGRTLRPEMTANVTLFLDTRLDVLAVPRGAVRRDRGRYVVYVLQDGQRVEREVRVGWRDDRYTEVVQGLEEGETVVIEAS